MYDRDIDDSSGQNEQPCKSKCDKAGLDSEERDDWWMVIFYQSC
jgi:hypothetical protein